MNADGIAVRAKLSSDGATLLDVDLSLPASGITGVFGASGAGKTTLLRCIAGLETAGNSIEGCIRIGEATWVDSADGTFVPTQSREVGYVFQEPRLFPHLSVRGNLDFAANRRRGRAAASDIVSLLGLSNLLDRSVDTLSGGEAQRVAIARALLGGPRLLLMDEPLASLDEGRKAELLPFLDRLHAELSIPILYVSHSIDEICRLCDHLVVLEQGRVLAEGPLQDVLTGHAGPLLGGDVAGSVIETTVENVDAVDELARLSFSGGELLVPGTAVRPGERLRLRIRASDVSLVAERPPASSILNILPAVVDEVSDAEDGMATLRLSLGQERLLARVTRRSVRDLGLAAGSRVFAQIKSAAIRNIPTAGHLDPKKEL